jgi:transcriptional regulator with XRE-family HTH domain
MIIRRLPNTTIPPVLPPLGANLRKAREASGLTQREMAQLLGLGSATAILLYEQEKRGIDALMLWKFSAICGVGVETLFTAP